MVSAPLLLSAFLLVAPDANAWSPQRHIQQQQQPATHNVASIIPSNHHQFNSNNARCTAIHMSSSSSTAQTFTSKFAIVSKLFSSNYVQLMRKILARFTHKCKTMILLSAMLAFISLLPQSAIAKSAASGSSSSVGGSVLAKSSSTGTQKVGKVVITLGAVGAGAATANVVRTKFLCSHDEDGGEEKVSANGDNNDVQLSAKTAANKSSDETVVTEIEPLSQEWIEQQLSDAEKRSNALNQAAKMTQVVAPSKSTPPPASSNKAPPVTKKTVNKSNKKLSVGPTIGIPLVKNLDSKIEHLQKRNTERSMEQQRINDELAMVEKERREVAIEAAEKKIEAAEREYRLSQQQQQEQVDEEMVVLNGGGDNESSPELVPSPVEVESQQAVVTKLAIKVGPGGTPAKSKEEDLELTTQVILEHVKSIDGQSGGVVDDEE